MTVVEFPDIQSRLRKERYWDAKKALRAAKRAFTELHEPELESALNHVLEAERLLIAYVMRGQE